MKFDLKGLPTPAECEKHQKSKEHLEKITEELIEVFSEKYGGAIVADKYKRMVGDDICIVLTLYFPKINHSFDFLEFRKNMFEDYPVDIFAFKGHKGSMQHLLLNSKEEIMDALRKIIESDKVKKIILSNI